MTYKVVQFNRIGNVTFSRNIRSKNIKISVKPDKTVLVSYPYFVSTKEVAAFVAKNEIWIRQQQNKFELKKNRFEDGSILKTKLFTIRFYKGEKNISGRSGQEIKVVVKDFNSEEGNLYIERVLTGVYRYEAKIILPGKLKQLAEHFGYEYNKITIRNNRRNWGSCSSKNNISLNLQMMKLPDELIEYILLHELVHTRIKNHGPKFWEKLNELTDNRAKELAKQVRKFSTYTL